MNNILYKNFSIIFFSFLLLINVAHSEEENILLKPFTLAKIYKAQHIKDISEKVKRQLSSAGYKIIGKYEPEQGVNIFIITNNALIKSAKRTEFGGFGAVIRVSVTQVKRNVQVSHTNPTYMGIAYRMKSYLTSTRKKLANTLGYVKDFGGKGIASNQLANYHYAFGLERFDGFMELAQHKSHQAALLAVKKGFELDLKNMAKVYQLDIPGKQQTIFGVSLRNDVNDQKFLNDRFVMNIIDNNELRRNAHLPYEIMVVGKRVITMHPHFRLAINFPDLRMFGAHSFGKLLDLPYVYEEFFIQLAGGIWPIPEEEY